MSRKSILLCCAFSLLIAVQSFAQGTFVAPPKIYRDPCTGWGTYDYGMGSASLYIGPPFTPSGINAEKVVVSDANEPLALWTIVAPPVGMVIFNITEQYITGELDYDIVQAESWVPSSYNCFTEFFRSPGSVPCVKAQTFGSFSSSIYVEIVQDLGETTITYSGTCSFDEYFEANRVYYEIDEE